MTDRDVRLRVGKTDHGQKWHALVGSGESAITACRGLSVAEHLGRVGSRPLAEDVPEIEWCELPECRAEFACVARWPYSDRECGCRWYVGDLDPHYLSRPCAAHEGETDP